MPLRILRDIRKIYAGLNADEIRGTATRDLNVGLMAASEEAYRTMERFLAPAWLDAYARERGLRAIHRVDSSPTQRFDFVLCERGLPVPSNGYEFHPADGASSVAAILKDHP